MDAEVESLRSAGILDPDAELTQVIEWDFESSVWRDAPFIRSALRVAEALSTPTRQLLIQRAYIIPRLGSPYALVVEIEKVSP